MPRPKIAVKKGKTTQAKSQTETRTGAPDAPKTQEQLIDELVGKIRENAPNGEKYIQVSESYKKVGPGLTLSGLQRVYKQPAKSDFIYSQEFKFAGSTQVVEQLLSKLGTSVATQRSKSDIIDANNYQDYFVVRPNRPPQADLLITREKMSELVKLVKQSRTAAKEEKGTPKKKKAQRRKSNAGVQVADRVSVSRLTASVSAVAEVIRQLAERQLGLDVSHLTFEETPEGWVAVGGRTFRPKPNPKSKRVYVDYSSGHLGSETSEALESFLRKIGHSDSEVSTLLNLFSSNQSKVENGKEEVQPVEAQPKKDKSKKAELRGSPKISKAKTRTVKPRTSHE